MQKILVSSSLRLPLPKTPDAKRYNSLNLTKTILLIFLLSSVIYGEPSVRNIPYNIENSQIVLIGHAVSVKGELLPTGDIHYQYKIEIEELKKGKIENELTVHSITSQYIQCPITIQIPLGEKVLLFLNKRKAKYFINFSDHLFKLSDKDVAKFFPQKL